MRSDAKRPVGRPRINPSGIITNIDLLNLKEKGTQFGKSVKLRESTYMILHDIKDNNEEMKSIDDVVLALIQIASAYNYGNKG